MGLFLLLHKPLRKKIQLQYFSEEKSSNTLLFKNKMLIFCLSQRKYDITINMIKYRCEVLFFVK